MTKPAIDSSLLKMPAVPVEAQVSEVPLKGWSSAQVQKESLSLLLAFQMPVQFTWQLKDSLFHTKPERHSHWSVWLSV